VAQLIVRNIEESVVRKLKQKAARDGVSMEEEHRRILRSSLTGKSQPPKMSFKEFLLTMPNVGEDSDFERPRSMPREIDLS
jgi:plasmid stability protein